VDLPIVDQVGKGTLKAQELDYVNAAILGCCFGVGDPLLVTL